MNFNKNPKIAIFWHRRDLRIHDNAGLYHALKSAFPVLSLFIFDSEILDKLANKQDARVTFIHQVLTEMQVQLNELGSTLLVKYGKPAEIWEELSNEFTIEEVYTNHDYEPYALERDAEIKTFLNKKNIVFNTLGLSLL